MSRIAALLALVALCLVSAPASAAAAADGLDHEAIDSYVSDYLHRNGLPGASIAVTQNGRVLHEAGFGQDGQGVPVTARTHMDVGSVSKSFTAFAVLQLVDGGEIDLDEPVSSYLPGFAVDDPRASTITVRQLLSHTSGLPNPTFVAPADTVAGAVARTRTWELLAEPGSQYYYSNANYWVAARLVEVVGGEPFPAYLERNVFGPLGMDSTRSVTKPGDDAWARNGHVTAYGTSLRLPELDSLRAGAGGVVTNAHDMARWLAMQTNHGAVPGGSRLLSPELLEEAHRRQPGAGDYCLGWSRSDPGVTPERISHSGTSTRYTAQQDLVPDSGYGVVVLLNSFTPALEHPYEISSGIITIATGGSATVGTPVPTIVDLSLGLVTLVGIVLAVRGLRRSRAWAQRRSHWSPLRFGLRLLPQLFAPAGAILLFVVTPMYRNNTSTVVDAFGLWPALTILLLTLGVAGVVLTATRVGSRVQSSGLWRSRKV